jgi:outer membrane protein TolC
MRIAFHRRSFRPLHRTLACAAGLAVGGCASIPADEAAQEAGRWAARVQAAAPRLATTDDARAALAAERARLLAEPLTQAGAAAVALQSSPAAQALLAEGWRLQTEAAAAARWPHLGIEFERVRTGGELELVRGLSLGLVDLLTWPRRGDAAARAVHAARLQLARDLLALHAATRAQWVRAVAARQLVAYRADVLDAAQAGDELARRLQAAGNFSRLQHARQQAFAADAQAQLARARVAAVHEREALARLLGLDEAESARLRLPERLPDLPQGLRSATEVAGAAAGERLDTLIAQVQLDAAAATERGAAMALADVEVGLVRGSDGRARVRGASIGVDLASIDSGALHRQGAGAATLAAAQRLAQAQRDAASELRARHAAYQAAHELALQQRDAVVPLRRTIAEETLLRYNGMLAGVFDVLAETRAQTGAVIAAIEAQRDFALAEVALDAAIVGVPAAGALPSAATASPGPEAAGGH